jgi:ADP-heptose:LPS heptosyltransferase
MIIKTDCRLYKGDIPCKPHKELGVHCEDCNYYKKTESNILIIKLGAIGDVIRTTPILRKLRATHPDANIYWLTYFPEILSSDWVDNIVKVSLENLEIIKAIHFDWLINLDKDKIAIALTKIIEAEKKSGFTMDRFGNAQPISNKPEEHKWLTGIFNDISKQNTKHYVQEIFEICGFNFNDEEYILEASEKVFNWDIDKSKKVIGLNTGCGGRWISRLWPDDYWVELTKGLINDGFEVVFLGGEQEHEKNLLLSKKSGGKYFGHFPLDKFISLVNECDLVVTAVTMAMHIAMGLKKKTIIFNNIFNRNEFYLYGRGEIIEPEFECNCYYSAICPNNCMQYIYPKTVINSLTKIISEEA